jgi:hypothetical protein
VDAGAPARAGPATGSGEGRRGAGAPARLRCPACCTSWAPAVTHRTWPTSPSAAGSIPRARSTTGRPGTGSAPGASRHGRVRDLPPDGTFTFGIGYPEAATRVADLTPDRPHAALVDPSAVVSPTAELDEGVQVFWQAGVSPLCWLGRHVLVSYGATVGHDTTLGTFTCVMPGARISGDVTVGAGVLVGTGAVILQGLQRRRRRDRRRRRRGHPRRPSRRHRRRRPRPVAVPDQPSGISRRGGPRPRPRRPVGRRCARPPGCPRAARRGPGGRRGRARPAVVRDVLARGVQDVALLLVEVVGERLGQLLERLLERLLVGGVGALEREQRLVPLGVLLGAVLDLLGLLGGLRISVG